MKKLSPNVIKQVKQMLFILRKETEKEILKWDNTIPAKDFYSDDRVMEALPFAAHEFCLLKRGICIDVLSVHKYLQHVSTSLRSNLIKFGNNCYDWVRLLRKASQ